MDEKAEYDAVDNMRQQIVAALSIVLVVIFTADMVYSGKVPNVGEGITDYDAYQQTGMVTEYVLDDLPGSQLNMQ